MLVLFVALVGLLPQKPTIVVVGSLPDVGVPMKSQPLPDAMPQTERKETVATNEFRAAVREETLSFSSFWPEFVWERQSEVVLPFSAHTGQFFGGPINAGTLPSASCTDHLHKSLLPQVRFWTLNASVSLPKDDRVVQVVARTASGREIDLYSGPTEHLGLFALRGQPASRASFAYRLYDTATGYGCPIRPAHSASGFEIVACEYRKP